MRRLVLHVGVYKTGTTSFQRWLRDNRDALAARGWLYPRVHLPGGVANHCFLGETPDGLWGGMVEALHRQVTGAEQPNVVLSAEAMCSRAPESYAWLAEWADVTVLCSVRRQDELAESMFREFSKNGRLDLSPAEFLRRYLRGEAVSIRGLAGERTHDEVLPFDQAAMLRRWAGVFGRERLTVLAYRPGEDAVAALHAAAGMAEPGPERSPERLNESFPARVVQVRQLLDRHVDPQLGAELEPGVWRASRRIADEPGTAFFGSGDRRRIMDAAAPSNAALAAEFLPDATADWLVDPHGVAVPDLRPVGPPGPDHVALVCGCIIDELASRPAERRLRRDP